MTDRERAYPILSKLKREGWIASYIAAQHPQSSRWGFKVTTTEGALYFFLPREAIAFAEGIKIAEQRIETALRVVCERAEGANARAQWVAEPARDALASRTRE